MQTIQEALRRLKEDHNDEYKAMSDRISSQVQDKLTYTPNNKLKKEAKNNSKEVAGRFYYKGKQNTSVYPAMAPDLSTARVIATDVLDIRGEYETNTCIMYSPKAGLEPVLTRLQVRSIITKDTAEGKMVICRPGRSTLYLPGGGFDLHKDRTFIDTAIREAYEEFNIKLTNVTDTKLYSWSYREDKFVTQHVANPEDRWCGYLTILITAEYNGDSDNENPEELNGVWKWKPISVLECNRYYKDGCRKLNLLETWGDGSHGKQDYTIPGMLSYCCENPRQVALIVQSNFIKGSSPEVDRTRKVPIGAGGRPKYANHSYVSFSKQLYSHAYRRPEKWGFGLLLDRNKLAQHYELTDHNSPYNQLRFNAVFVSDGGKYVLRCTSSFGYVEVPKEIADIVLDAMTRKTIRMGAWVDAGLSRSTIKSPEEQKAAWEVETMRPTKNLTAMSANKNIKGINFDRYYRFAGSDDGADQFSVQKNDFTDADWNKIMTYLLEETYYNEGEERIWLRNGENGIEIPTGAVKGIIIPKIVEKDFVNAAIIDEEVSDPQQVDAINYLTEYMINNNIGLYVHDASDDYHIRHLGKLHGIKNNNNR